MSLENKQRFDTYFKIFIATAIAFFGWLGSRTADKFDSIESSVETIRVNSEGMKTDIEWLKKAYK